MIKVEMKGPKATVTRTLVLPAQGVLAKPWKNTASFEIRCELKIKSTEPLAKQIFADFLNRFDPKLKALGARREKSYREIWQTAAKELAAILHERTAFKARSERLYDELDSIWTSFAEKEARATAEECLKQAVAAATASGELDKRDAKTKVGVWSGANDGNRQTLWAWILKITAGGATAGPVGVGVAAVVGAFKGYAALRDILVRRSPDATRNAQHIVARLTDAEKALADLTPALKALAQTRKDMNTAIMRLDDQFGDTAKTAKAAQEAGAGGDKAAKAMGAIETQVSSAQRSLADLYSGVEALAAMIKDINTASSAIGRAKALAEGEKDVAKGVGVWLSKHNGTLDRIAATLAAVEKAT